MKNVLYTLMWGMGWGMCYISLCEEWGEECAMYSYVKNGVRNVLYILMWGMGWGMCYIFLCGEWGKECAIYPHVRNGWRRTVFSLSSNKSKFKWGLRIFRLIYSFFWLEYIPIFWLNLERIKSTAVHIFQRILFMLLTFQIAI